MFLFNSLHQGNVVSGSRKASRNRNGFSSLRSHWARSVFALVVMFCLSTAFMFTGCNTGDDTAGNLNGTWKNVASYEGTDYITIIKIDTSAKTIMYEDSYEGQIANSQDFTATNGVLIIKFTKYADWGEDPSATHANVGKFGAMYWTGLTSNQVSLADAYTSYTHTMFDSIEAAQTAFTPAADKVGTYVDWSMTSPYTKQ
jgi:hypothetical protein